MAAPESFVFTISKEVQHLSAVDTEIQLASPASFGSNVRLRLQCQKFVVSTSIPNIFDAADIVGRHNFGTFNNTTIKLSRDFGASWTTVKLNTGLYATIPILSTAISSAVSAWWTDPTKPGFVISYDMATSIAYISLDSTKLAIPGQLEVDLSGSYMYYTLGFNNPANQLFDADGFHVGDSQASMDLFGSELIVSLVGFGNLSVYNSQTSEVFCVVPMSNPYGGANNTTWQYPLSNMSPSMTTQQVVPPITRYSMKITGNRRLPSGALPQLLLFDGNCELTFTVQPIAERR